MIAQNLLALALGNIVNSIYRQFQIRREAQHGINMVDLMMWLVIAALLLAAAIQTIGYYQQATYVYHAKSDLAGAHSWVSASRALNSRIPTPDDFQESIDNGELKLTEVSNQSNIGLIAVNSQKYCIGVKSPLIKDLSRNVFYSTSDEPRTIIRSTNIPASCGTVTAFAPIGVDTSGAVIPSAAPAVTGEVAGPTTAEFYWDPVPGASGYKIEKQINGGGWNLEEANYPDLGILVEGVESETINVRVTAVNAMGESAISNIATVTLPPTTPSDFVGFGMNTSSQLNNGGVVNALSPVKVLKNGALSGKKITTIGTGSGYSCALAETKVYCWGSDMYGFLGNGSAGDQPTPTEINMSNLTGKTITALAVSENHACLIASGVPYCWGHGGNGKLGNNNAGGVQQIPTAVFPGALAGKTAASIAVSSGNTCVVTTDSKGYCWGYNYYGEVRSGQGSSVVQPMAIDDTGALAGKTIVSLQPGSMNTCALDSEGAVYCWGHTGANGHTGNGQSPQQIDMTGVMAGKKASLLSVGGGSACIIANDAKLYCWGTNSRGQLGNADTVWSAVPVASDPYGVFDGRPLTALSVGADHACAIAGGRPFCWGNSDHGRLGNGTLDWRYFPKDVDVTGSLSGKTALTVSAGTNGTFVGYSDISLPVFTAPVDNSPKFSALGWGHNGQGKLDSGNTNDALTPVAMLASGELAGKKISKIDSGGDTTCAIAGGELYCWGSNNVGQTGQGAGTASFTTPRKVFSDGWLRNKIVTDVSTNGSHTCAVAGGKAYCWGMNNNGQTGNSPTGFYYSAPVPAVGAMNGKTVTDIDVGGPFTCAVADGKPYCWGYNNEGMLGSGDYTMARFPVAVVTSGVLSGKTTTAVSAGSWSACAVADGKPYCWGSNQMNLLGDGVTSGKTATPVAVKTSGNLNGKTVVSVGVGIYHACVLADQRSYCWGYNGNGQLGDGNTVNQSSDPLATNPSGLMAGKNVSHLGVGDTHACALAEGSVYCWGINTNGRLGNGTTTQSVTPVVVSGPSMNGVTPTQLWVGGSSNFLGY